MCPTKCLAASLRRQGWLRQQKIFRSTIYMYASHLECWPRLMRRHHAATVPPRFWLWHTIRNVYTYPDGDRESGTEDAAIVATHLMLAATDEGVDSCWINCFHARMLHELLGLPEREELLMLLDLGYAAEGSGPLPNHSLRKPLSETVTRI